MSDPAQAAGIGTPDGERLRILLVDDQRLVRSGFSLILSVEPDLEVVGQAADGAAAVELARRLRPDVILMDVQMPVMDGIEATAKVVAEELGRVLVLTTFDRDDYLFDALRAGASGFVLKNADPDHLVEAVRAVGHGHALLAPEVTRRVIERMVADAHDSPPDAHDSPPDARSSAGPPGRAGRVEAGPMAAGPASRPTQPSPLARLTGREREVLTLVAQGMSNAEIAAELFLGEATVKTHVSNCLTKLHLRDRVQAVVLAYRLGLVQPSE